MVSLRSMPFGRLAVFAVVIIALVVSVGLLATSAFARERGPASNHAATSQVGGEMVVGGRARTYQLLRPVAVKPGVALPLVVVLHGGFGTGSGAIVQGNWRAAVATHGFVVVAPDGVARSWNAGLCCGPAVAQGVDDVGFVVALVHRISGQLDIDPRRIYATGISNGGMMAYRLACEASGLFAAAAPVAATLPVACDQATPVSILHIHGLADRNVPFAGGFPTVAFQRNPPDYPPVLAGLASWASIDRCGSPTTVTTGKVATWTWRNCQPGIAVQLITISDGGHSWPGGQRMALILDPPSRALDATSTIWNFFAAHPKA